MGTIHGSPREKQPPTGTIHTAARPCLAQQRLVLSSSRAADGSRDLG